jgi:hypothetical protein
MSIPTGTNPAGTATGTPTQPQASATPTVTATATSPFNQPGLYTFSNRCSVIGILETTITVDYCLVSVAISNDGAMRFDLSWTAHVAGSGYDYVEVHPDGGNAGLYLTDDLANRYDFFGLLGLAAYGGLLADGETGYSSYLFPPAESGATSFAFHNESVEVVFTDIVLSH